MLTLLFKESKDLGDTVSLLESVVNSRLASFFFFLQNLEISKSLQCLSTRCTFYYCLFLFILISFKFFFTGFIKFYYHVY